MAELDRISISIRKRLDKKNLARESVIRQSRKIIRECRSAMSAMQGGREYQNLLDSARKSSRDLIKFTERYPELLFAGYAIDSLQELAEAEILASFVEKRKIPSPEAIQVPDEAFVLGLGDSIGELRRMFLDRLMNDDINAAKKIIDAMENMYRVLMTFDYPDALLSSRRKQDVARSILEKTRSELVMSTHMHALRHKLKK